MAHAVSLASPIQRSWKSRRKFTVTRWKKKISQSYQSPLFLNRENDVKVSTNKFCYDMKKKQFTNLIVCLFYSKLANDKWRTLTNSTSFLSTDDMVCEAMYFETGLKNKGLLINNFVFKRHYQTNQIIYWQCTLCRRLKCRARAITRVQDPSIVIIKCSDHNHTVDAYTKVPKEVENLEYVKSEHKNDDAKEITFA